jgi:hypothetical protein
VLVFHRHIKKRLQTPNIIPGSAFSPIFIFVVIELISKSQYNKAGLIFCGFQKQGLRILREHSPSVPIKNIVNFQMNFQLIV